MVAFVGGVGWAEIARKWVESQLPLSSLFDQPLPRVMVVLRAEPQGETIKSEDDWRRVRQKIVERRKAKKGY